MSEVYKSNFNLFHFKVLSESKDSFSESEDFSEAESLQILQGESDTQSASDNFQSLVFIQRQELLRDKMHVQIFLYKIESFNS